MAGLLDLFSGRSSDIYGNGLLTPEQRGGLGNIGLLALAGKLGQLAGPSFSPVPDFGAALGQAAGAYGASQEGAGTAALNAILTGQKGRKLEQELDYYKQLGPILGKLAGQWPGAGGGAGGGEGSGSTGGGAAAPPGAGGGGGPGSDPRGMVPHITAEATRLGIDPAVALQVARSEGLGIFSGDGGKSGGAFQLYTGGGMGNDFIRDTGLNPLDPKNEKATITYALEQAAEKGWGAWNGAKRLGITGFAGIGKPGAAPTAAAPTGGGGLLNLPDPSGIGARAGFGLPAAAAVAPGASPEETANRIVKGWTAGSGSSAAAPPDIYAGTDTPQGPMGDPGPAGPTAMASGLLAPGGPLTRGGVPGMPAMSPAPAPSADPSLQLGPLAPAPAAAAAAAPGPGLLSPPGMPAAAALPRVNPAYDAYLRNLALAGTLAEGAGLKNVFAPLTDALKASPAFQAQLEIARKTAGLPFIGPETTAKKAAEEPFDIRASERALGNALTEKGWRLDANGQAVRIPGYDKMEEATAFANAKGKGEGELQTTLIIKSVENQNKIIADAAANGNQVTFDKDGKMSVSRLPGADAAAGAQAGAVTGAQEEAKARVAAGTAPGIAGQTKYAETTATQDATARAQAIAARNTLPLLDDAKEQLTGAGIFSGPAATLNMTLAQVATAAGWPSDQLVNTQTYIQQAGARAAEILRSGAYGTGSGISQNDLRAADKLANGDITLDIKTIKRIMDLAERKAARDIDNFNVIANKRDPTSAVEHPPRWTGRYTSDGKRIDKMPDGSLQVKE